MHAAVRHNTKLACHSRWYVQLMELVVQECRQTTIELMRVAEHAGGSFEHSL